MTVYGSCFVYFRVVDGPLKLDVEDLCINYVYLDRHDAVRASFRRCCATAACGRHCTVHLSRINCWQVSMCKLTGYGCSKSSHHIAKTINIVCCITSSQKCCADLESMK